MRVHLSRIGAFLVMSITLFFLYSYYSNRRLAVTLTRSDYVERSRNLVLDIVSDYGKRSRNIPLDIVSDYGERSTNLPLHTVSDYGERSTSLSLDPVIWTTQPTARLGNKMGEYAILYALAKLNGHKAYVLPQMHSELGKIFKLSLPVIPQEVADSIKWRKYLIKDWMSPEYLNISGQYVKLCGTPCSWTFYHHIREEILQEFTFHDSIKNEANSYLQKLRRNKVNVTYIGVHVRRGDYVNVMLKKRKGVVADKNYLQKATDYFRQKYDNPLFVVASNDMRWCKENINNSLGDVYFVGDGKERSPIHDFALLAHCNHTIMTIGTFGYWAAYLAGGETIYLTNFTLPDSPYLNIFKYTAAFLPEWIGISADLSPLLGKQEKAT